MNKTLKVMTSAALLAGVVAPVAVTTVDAAGNIEMTQGTKTVSDSGNQDLGVVKVTVPAGSNTNTHTLTIKLSDGTFTTFDATNIEIDSSKNGDGNFTSSDIVIANSPNGTDTVKVQFNDDVALSEDLVFYVKLNPINVTGVTGEISAEFFAPSTSGIPSGKVVVANAVDEETVGATITGTESKNDAFKFKLRLKESLKGSMQDGDKIELKLPNGYVWKTGTTGNEVYGDNTSVKGVTGDGKDTIEFKVDRSAYNYDTLLEVELFFEVEDPTAVKDGDVVASIKTTGFSIDASEFVVGQYGDYGTTVTSDADKDVYSGKEDQKIATVSLKETLADTLIDNRSFTLTLPEGVEWNTGTATTATKNENVGLDNGKILSDGKVLKFEINGNSNGQDPAEIKIKDLKVDVAADFVGDIVAEIGGSAGVTGKVTLAKSQSPIEAKALSVPSLIIGDVAQEIGDIEITELVKEAFENQTSSNDNVQLVLPEGVHWDGTPSVEVTDGDLKIQSVKTSENILTFDVKSESFKPSKIVVSDAKVKVLRYVPEGEVTLKVQGGDLIDREIGNADTIAKVAVAKVVTPAEGKGTATTTVFTIGSTTYTVDGAEKVADVAPFVEASTGRTYMPVRFVAESVGVGTNNILWDQASQTATIIKGDRIAQLTVGSNVLKVNGANIGMDSKVQNKDGRVVLPVRAVSQALGANVEYDAATSTVTVK